jgi:hypothetical protein
LYSATRAEHALICSNDRPLARPWALQHQCTVSAKEFAQLVDSVRSLEEHRLRKRRTRERLGGRVLRRLNPLDVLPRGVPFSKRRADESPQAACVAHLLLVYMASEDAHRARDCGLRVLESAAKIPTPHRNSGTQKIDGTAQMVGTACGLCPIEKGLGFG